MCCGYIVLHYTLEQLLRFYSHCYLAHHTSKEAATSGRVNQTVSHSLRKKLLFSRGGKENHTIQHNSHGRFIGVREKRGGAEAVSEVRTEQEEEELAIYKGLHRKSSTQRS